MTTSANKLVLAARDPLSDYVAGVRKLPEKLAQIAENKRQSAVSLGRTAVLLRSIAALNESILTSGKENPLLKAGNSNVSIQYKSA